MKGPQLQTFLLSQEVLPTNEKQFIYLQFIFFKYMFFLNYAGRNAFLKDSFNVILIYYQLNTFFCKACK